MGNLYNHNPESYTMQQYRDHRYTAVTHVTDQREPFSFETDDFANALRYLRPGECFDYGVIIDELAGRVVYRQLSLEHWNRERGFPVYRLACNEPGESVPC